MEKEKLFSISRGLLKRKVFYTTVSVKIVLQIEDLKNIYRYECRDVEPHPAPHIFLFVSYISGVIYLVGAEENFLFFITFSFTFIIYLCIYFFELDFLNV